MCGFPFFAAWFFFDFLNGHEFFIRIFLIFRMGTYFSVWLLQIDLRVLSKSAIFFEKCNFKFEKIAVWMLQFGQIWLFVINIDDTVFADNEYLYFNINKFLTGWNTNRTYIRELSTFSISNHTCLQIYSCSCYSLNKNNTEQGTVFFSAPLAHTLFHDTKNWSTHACARWQQCVGAVRRGRFVAANQLCRRQQNDPT